MNLDILIRTYVSENSSELISLITELMRIPSPTGKEQDRAEYCRGFLQRSGAKDVRVDDARNVICTIEGVDTSGFHIFSAHMDTVFPETVLPELSKEGDTLRGPGVGDNTANLAVLLMCARFLLQNALKPRRTVLFVCNSCEEGEGNLLGMRTLMKNLAKKPESCVAFDGYINQVTNRAVGSTRYKIEVTTQGGHSFFDFGAPNAIVHVAELIGKLNSVKLPTHYTTTFNFGRIEGGISVNTIAPYASVLYEYRSEDQLCLDHMEGEFNKVMSSCSTDSATVTTNVIGSRPGSRGVNELALAAFTERNVECIRKYYPDEITVGAASTDSNIPLSMGIPSNTIGTVLGGGAHTYQEWISLSSLEHGFPAAIEIVCRVAGLLDDASNCYSPSTQ